MLDEARRKAEIIETQMLEVDMAYSDESGNYQSTMYDILITINEFLGENATISYDLYVKGDPVQGKTKITSGKPTFTAGE